MQTMNCYLCHDTSFSSRKGTVRDAPALRIVECSGCGLVSLSSQAHIGADHYEQSGMHGDSVPAIESWLRDCERDDRRRFEMLKTLLVNRKVLDFGCGAGGFLRMAQAVAARVAGIEPEKRVRQHWGESLALFENLDSAGVGYDVITAFHVVEHLPDPRSSLAQLAQCLQPNGRLIVEVPSSEDALLTLYDSDAFQRFTYWSQHLYLFSAETLRRLAVQAGLKVHSIRQVQRYPLSNHLHWLSRNAPGGHVAWSFLDSPALEQAYADSLAAVGKCDTLVATLGRA